MSKLLNSSTTVHLHDGNEMPIFGLGVYASAVGGETQQAVRWAIKHGYSHFDTAAFYRNEEDVGKAIKESGIPRDKLFVTTKIWNSEHGYEKTLAAGQESLKKLDIGYIDLLLMHAPGTETVSTWKAMAELKEQGVCKSIGVSNFGVHHMVELQKATSILPTVNQLEITPYLQRREIVEYCHKNGIVVEGYSPLTKGQKLIDQPLVEIAAKYPGKSTAQVLIRWSLQQGYVTIPKSVKEERIKANIDVFDFELSQEDIDRLGTLEENLTTGWDPTTSPWNP